MKNNRLAICFLVIILSFFLFISSVNGVVSYRTTSENEERPDPEVEITSPSQGSNLGEDDVDDGLMVRWSAGDPDGNIVETTVELVGIGIRNVDTGNTVTFDGVPTDQHEVIVTVWNDGGSSSSDSVEFIVDRESPNLNIVSPNDGESIPSSTVLVNWSGDGGLSDIREYRIRVNREDPWINVGTDTSYELTDLEEDDYLVEIEATDRAWNTEVRRVSFNVDGTPPTLNILSPSQEDSKISQSLLVTIMWSGSDEGSGIDYYEIRINGGEWIDVGTNTKYTFSGLFDGENTVDIKAVDNAGNEQIETTTFEVDPGSPSEIFTMRMILGGIIALAIIGLVTIVMIWKYLQEQRRFNKISTKSMNEISKMRPKKKLSLKKKES